MADYSDLISVLNQAVSLEYTAVIQYNQHSVLLTGPDKAVFEEIFREHSEEALDHAKRWAEKIVWLGGVPTVEVGTIHQSTDVKEMLEMNLALEEKAVETYLKARKMCKHEPTAYLLEDHIMDEQEDVEQMQKLLARVKIAEGTVTIDKEVKAG